MRLCESPCPPRTARSSFPQPGVDIPAFTHLATLRSTPNLGTLGHRNRGGEIPEIILSVKWPENYLVWTRGDLASIYTCSLLTWDVDIDTRC